MELVTFYALTGKIEELQDLQQKINAAEKEEKERHLKMNLPTGDCGIGALACQLGRKREEYQDMGVWWDCYECCDALKCETTDDGEQYMKWNLNGTSYDDIPKVCEMIESAYSGIKVYYDTSDGYTTDTEERYLKHFLHQIDGANYYLQDDGTADLHCDKTIKGKVLHVPEQVEYRGRVYTVTGFGDMRWHPDYGPTSAAPAELEEIYFPATIKEITPPCSSMKALKAIHFAGDIDYIDSDAFQGCEQLSLVEFAGKVQRIGSYAFADTAIRNIDIPDGAYVEDNAFSDTPMDLKKSIDIVVEYDVREMSEGDIRFLRQMQHRMDVHLGIGYPSEIFGIFGIIVPRNAQTLDMDSLTENLSDELRWIHDKLSVNLLLRTTISRDISRKVSDKSDLELFFIHEDSYTLRFHIDGESDSRRKEFRTIGEVEAWLLNMDANIQELKNSHEPEDEGELPF